jgi:antitoxin VapB
MSSNTRYSLDRPRQDHGVRQDAAMYFAAAQSADVNTTVRTASLFRNGRSQAVRIPREFEFPPGEVTMYKDGQRLIIEPIAKTSALAALFASWEPLDDEFPDVDAGLLPLGDVTL